jgi:hypothetical protein
VPVLSEALRAGDVPVLEPRAGLEMNGLDEGLVQVKHEDRVLRAELILDHAVVGLCDVVLDALGVVGHCPRVPWRAAHRLHQVHW